MGLSCHRTLQPHPHHGTLQHLALKNSHLCSTEVGFGYAACFTKAMWAKVPVLNFGLHRHCGFLLVPPEPQ